MDVLLFLGACALGVLSLALAALLVGELLPERRSLRPGAVPGLAETADSHRIAGHLTRLQVLHAAANGLIYGMEDHWLYVSRDGGLSFERRGALPPNAVGFMGRIKDLLLRSKVVRRLRRNPGPNCMEVLSSGTILIFYGRIFRSSDGGWSFHEVCDPAALGLSAGPFIFGVGTAVTPDDTVYLGEYTTAERPHPAHILRGRDDGRHWEIAHRFESGRVFHVHSITYDPYRHGLWVCTGDTDEETALLFTSDHFKTLTPVGKGSQDWRIVSLLVTRDALYWCSDNDREDGASLFRWDIAAQTLERLQHVGKVCYYATQLADGTLVVNTTHEPESPYTRAHAPAATTELWASRDGRQWQRLLELPRESITLPWGPARAQIAFPRGRPLDRLFLIPRYTRGNPFATVVLDLTLPAPSAQRQVA